MRYSDYTPYLQGLLRLVVAALFMLHGSQKLFGFPSGEPITVEKLLTLIGAAGIIEFFGGFFVLIGFSTRLFAFILSGEMVIAYLKAHVAISVWPLLNGGELAMLYCVIFLYFSSAGAGKFSIDSARGIE